MEIEKRWMILLPAWFCLVAFAAGYGLALRHDSRSSNTGTCIHYNDWLAVHALVDNNGKLVGIFKVQDIRFYGDRDAYKASFDAMNKTSFIRVFLSTITPPRGQ